MGQLRFIMTQCLLELGLALVMNGEQWPEGMGCFSNGPKRAFFSFLPQYNPGTDITLAGSPSSIIWGIFASILTPWGDTALAV